MTRQPADIQRDEPIESWHSFVGIIDITTARSDEVVLWGAPVALAILDEVVAEEPAPV